MSYLFLKHDSQVVSIHKCSYITHKNSSPILLTVTLLFGLQWLVNYAKESAGKIMYYIILVKNKSIAFSKYMKQS